MEDATRATPNPAEHLASRYGWLAAVLALASLAAIQRGWAKGYGWHVVVVVALWCLAAAVLLHLAYAENDVLCFGKREDGGLPLVARIVFLPYFVPLWLRQIVIVSSSGDNPHDALVDGIFIGRWPTRRSDIPEGAEVCVDLAAEFSASRVERKVAERYVSFPILEAGFRSCEDLAACIDSLPVRGVYIHCAQGHGRTGFFACAFLLRRGVAKTLPEALERLNCVRPGARLRKAQIAYLEAHADALKP